MAEDTSGSGGDRPSPTQPARQPSGADIGWGITGTLLSGIAVWGGVGWLLDRWWDTGVFFAVGVLLGVAVAIYVVVVKYGAVDPPPGRQSSGDSSGGRRSRPRTQKGQR